MLKIRIDCHDCNEETIQRFTQMLAERGFPLVPGPHAVAYYEVEIRHSGGWMQQRLTGVLQPTPHRAQGLWADGIEQDPHAGVSYVLRVSSLSGRLLCG